MSNYQLSTIKEQKIIEIICLRDFKSDGRFKNISQKLFNRIARRSERVRLNKMVKADFINGFKRENYPHITQFEKTTIEE